MGKTASVLLTTLLATQASIGIASEKLTVESARKSLPESEVREVNPTPISGLYEVISGGNVLYMDESGRYLLIGEIYDLQTGKNITASRLEEITRIDFSSLPLDKAVKIGSGKHKLAVFYDPDCPYCKRLYSELKDLKEFTIYYFFYPLREIHPEAYRKSISIWCSSDKAKALDEAEGGREIDRKVCPHPVDETIALGQKLGVSGTPTIILEDGRRISGYVPKEELLSGVRSDE